jgi:hypothetical protein
VRQRRLDVVVNGIITDLICTSVCRHGTGRGGGGRRIKSV